MKVDVYRNLHRKCWSVRNTKTGRVIQHLDELVLTNTTFHVHEAGRQKVLRTKQKNVHAFIRGSLAETINLDTIWKKAQYNPYTMNCFTDVNQQRVKQAKRVVFWADGQVWYNNGEYDECID